MMIHSMLKKIIILFSKKTPTYLSFFREIDTNLHKFCEVVELSAIGDDCFEEHFVLVLDAYSPIEIEKNEITLVCLPKSIIFGITQRARKFRKVQAKKLVNFFS